MLPRSSKTSFSSNIPALEGVHPTQEYVADLQSKPVKDFPDLDEEKEEGHGNKHAESNRVTATEEKNSESDLMQLLPKKDFSDLFQQFFVVEHKNLTLLQSKILLARDFNPNTLISTIDAHEIHILRQQLYDLQVNIFQNPKGQQYDTLW